LPTVFGVEMWDAVIIPVDRNYDPQKRLSSGMWPRGFELLQTTPRLKMRAGYAVVGGKKQGDCCLRRRDRRPLAHARGYNGEQSVSRL
jgi:hypothetical protein